MSTQHFYGDSNSKSSLGTEQRHSSKFWACFKMAKSLHPQNELRISSRYPFQQTLNGLPGPQTQTHVCVLARFLGPGRRYALSAERMLCEQLMAPEEMTRGC